MQIPKYFIAVLLFTLLSFSSWGQKNILVRTAYNEKDMDSISPFFYTPISIYPPYKTDPTNGAVTYLTKIRSENLSVLVDSGVLVKNKKRTDFNCFYFLRINESANRIKLKFYDKKRLFDSTYIYKAKTLPLPEIKFCRFHQSEGVFLSAIFPTCIKAVSIEELTDSLGNLINFDFKIQSFIADIYIKGQKVFTENVTGDTFSELFNKWYDKTYPNDKIVLRTIVVKDQYNNTYIIPKEEFKNLSL